MLAASRGQTEILRALILAGADLTEVSLEDPVIMASFLYFLLIYSCLFVSFLYSTPSPAPLHSPNFGSIYVCMCQSLTPMSITLLLVSCFPPVQDLERTTGDALQFAINSDAKTAPQCIELIEAALQGKPLPGLFPMETPPPRVSSPLHFNKSSLIILLVELTRCYNYFNFLSPL